MHACARTTTASMQSESIVAFTDPLTRQASKVKCLASRTQTNTAMFQPAEARCFDRQKGSLAAKKPSNQIVTATVSYFPRQHSTQCPLGDFTHYDAVYLSILRCMWSSQQRRQPGIYMLGCEKHPVQQSRLSTMNYGVGPVLPPRCEPQVVYAYSTYRCLCLKNRGRSQQLHTHHTDLDLLRTLYTGSKKWSNVQPTSTKPDGRPTQTHR